ncbi:hypothetical protein BAQ53_24495 [Bacillus sp. B25(2016b)]|uniref:DUF6076 domain-containing protein n=1 Tax=Bacillus sp. B25(2016b) TaxID=1868655 RepID=UPI00080425DE|nr:DUF6076 domain-containing protein [Bacillus sp. B25(2016b)]ANP83888.1 hypothetical protein BAQ53_24495 [Bacillus sp. B25(2016b)]
MEKNFLTISGLEENVMVCNEYSLLSTEDIIANTSDYFSNIENIPEGFRRDTERNRALNNPSLEIINTFCLDEDFSNWANFYKVSTHKLKSMLHELHFRKPSDDIQKVFAEAGHPEIVAKPELIKEDIKFYNPFNEGNSLFTELPKLKIWDLKELKRFIKVYGLPTGSGIYKITALYDSKNILFRSVQLRDLFIELTIYRYIFSLFLAVKTKDINQLQFFKSKYHPTINIQNNEELILLEKKTLIFFLNKQNRISQKLIIETVNEKPEIIPIVQFTNLFDVAYFQMTKSLLQDTVLRKCEHCGHYFEAAHESRRFCPPLPFRKRSSCETAYNRNKVKKKNTEE